MRKIVGSCRCVEETGYDASMLLPSSTVPPPTRSQATKYVIQEEFPSQQGGSGGSGVGGPGGSREEEQHEFFINEIRGKSINEGHLRPRTGVSRLGPPSAGVEGGTASSPVAEADEAPNAPRFS